MEESNRMVPKVSVIVPVYHSEAYLERCCRSLLSQTLDDIEFLFIIDGPSKLAEQIISKVLSAYPLRQRQVTLIKHTENRGISYSRQEGHDRASGDYLFHCDSDDWIELDALKTVYELADKEQTDLVFFDYVRHYEGSKKEILYRYAHVEQGKISTMDASLHNIFIRRQFVSDHGLRFPLKINWGEDLCMSFMLQVLTKKIKYLPQSLYHYYMHANSYITDTNESKYMQLVSCPCYIEKELVSRQLLESNLPMLMQMKFEVKEYYLLHPKLRNVTRWLSIYPECHSSIWQYPSVPLYLKIISWMAVSHLPWFAKLLLDCRDIIHSIRR